jgi:hypothetical protein
MANIKNIDIYCKSSPARCRLVGVIKYSVRSELFSFKLPEWGHHMGKTELEDKELTKLENAIHKWVDAIDSSNTTRTLVILYKLDKEKWQDDCACAVGLSAGLYWETYVRAGNAETGIWTYESVNSSDKGVPACEKEERTIPWEMIKGMGIHRGANHTRVPCGRIEYTPEGARMFRAIYDGIMRIKDMLEGLTATPEATLEAVKSFSFPALAAPPVAVESRVVPILDLDPCPECRWPGGRIEDTEAGIAEAVRLHAKHCPTCTIHPLDLRP